MRGRPGRTCALALGAALLLTGLAEAKTFEVTRTNDPNPGACKPNDCSLREAVLAANARPGADGIVLPAAKRYKFTRANPGAVDEDVGTSGDLDINTDPLSISHPGKGRATIDANDLDRVLEIQDGAATAFRDIVVTGGDESNGGGILTSANVRLVRSIVAGNTASNDGGGIDSIDFAAVTLVRSQIRKNVAADDGGAINGGEGDIVLRRSRLIRNEAGDAAGAIRTTSAPTLTVLRSSVIGNTAAESGGGLEISSGTALVMRQSTIASNTAGGNGGGIYAASGPDITIDSSTISDNRANGSNSNGGGVYLDGPTATITNSTIDGNRASDFGGGIQAQDGADLTLNAVTVTRNVAATSFPLAPPLRGGGLYRLSSAGFDVRNSLIALNASGANGSRPNDCSGDTPFDSLGNNILSTEAELGNCPGFDELTDLVRANPKIGKLKKNGGPTETVALKQGSAAIGHAHKPSAPDRDQRGRKRDNNPDTGAYERGA